MSAFQSYLQDHQARLLDELTAFLKIPSISTDSTRRGDVRRAATFLNEKLEALGFQTELAETARHPAVLACYQAGESLPTVLIYGHYDVQPPDPEELWHSPPFEPTVKDGVITARGASDDKGQVYAHVKGVEALLARDGTLPVNVIFLIEGEEEIGSPNLPQLIRERRDALAADVVVISDGAMIAADTPTLTYGLKGLAYVEVEVTAANRDLHSGAYGGGVPNPINALATMIAQLKDENGRISVPGFYDPVLELAQDERDAFAHVPFDEQAFADALNLTATPGESGYTLLERLWARPTLDVNGITGGFQGEGAKTVIAAKASAKISCRLVPHQQPEDITRKLSDYLTSLAPEGVRVKVHELHGGHPALTPIDSPAVQQAAEALTEVYGKAPVFARTGGSIPVVSDFQQQLGVPVVLVGFGLEDDNIHSPNERFGVENYLKGIETSAALLSKLSQLQRA